MALIKWLRKPVFPSFELSEQIDVDKLDHSMRLLRNTTAEVSQAAVEAARVLETQLHNAERRFNSTVDHITDLVIIKDPQGQWLYLNKVGQEVYGWHHGEFFGKTDAQLAELFPQYKRSLEYCAKTDVAAWECKRAFRAEETVPHGDKTVIFDVIKTPIFTDQNVPKELIIIGRDVTEAIEKHQRTKACFQALNSASDVIAIVDHNCRIFFCNDRFVEEFHVQRYENAIGMKLADVIGSLDPTMWPTVEANKQWVGKFEKYDLNVLPMMNGAPKPIYHVCTFKTPK